MSKKCNNCGAKIIEYPLWEGQELGEPFEWKKIKWYNALVGDWTKLLVFISLLFLAWSYYHDTQAIREIYQNPCEFVNANQLPCQFAKESGFFPSLNESDLSLQFNLSIT